MSLSLIVLLTRLRGKRQLQYNPNPREYHNSTVFWFEGLFVGSTIICSDTLSVPVYTISPFDGRKMVGNGSTKHTPQHTVSMALVEINLNGTFIITHCCRQL